MATVLQLRQSDLPTGPGEIVSEVLGRDGFVSIPVQSYPRARISYLTYIEDNNRVLHYLSAFLLAVKNNKDLPSIPVDWRDPPPPLDDDPELLNRAMLFLRARGAVLYYDHVPALRDRVFIRPQWLVDVIKELVRHDLQEQIGLLDPCFDDVEATRQLAQEFLESGILRAGLLPWLWRELDPPVGHDRALVPGSVARVDRSLISARVSWSLATVSLQVASEDVECHVSSQIAPVPRVHVSCETGSGQRQCECACVVDATEAMGDIAPTPHSSARCDIPP